MKIIVYRTVVFVLIVFLFDRILGFVSQGLYNTTKDYTISKLRYTIDSTKQDILILGSSRAQHHFIPDIFENNTGYSTFNCGFGGQGLQFSYIQLYESLKRYKPKIVVIDISPNVLLDPDSQQKLKILLPFFQRDTLIYNALTNRKSSEKLKFISSIYPYNSTIVSLIRGYIKQNNDSLNGFIPLTGLIDTTDLTKQINAGFPGTIIPDEKFYYLKALISLCKENNISTVAVVSPIYQTNEDLDHMVGQIEKSCESLNGLYFFDLSKYSEIYKHMNLFKDNLHLNLDGAIVYSEVLSQKLKSIN